MRPLVAFALVCIVIGCGGYTSSVTTKDSPGWIKLVGSTSNITVSIDNGEAWSPSKKVDRYELAPGTHEIRIFRSGQLILQRALLITEGIESEVAIP
jgi:hypothetical protein